MSRSIRIYAFAALALFLCSPLLPAQIGGSWENIHHHFTGTVENNALGETLSGDVDVNGDGVPDVLIGDPKANSGGGTERGAAVVYSGADGSQLWLAKGVDNFDHFGTAVTMLGDINNDTFGDWAVTDEDTAYVYTGPAGTLLRTHHAIYGDIKRVGDANGDLCDDYVIGNEFAMSTRGSVVLMSGQTGLKLWRKDGTQPGAGFGRSVAGAGDIDGDGLPDVIAAAPEFDASGGGGAVTAGRIWVWSGATGNTIQRYDGLTDNEYYGAAVDGLGDLNGDNMGEYIVGVGDKSIFDAGRAEVRDGATGTVLLAADAPASVLGYGSTVSGPGDIDGDGTPDILIGAPFKNSATPTDGRGRIFVHSGADGHLFASLKGAGTGYNQGSQLAAAGDIDGDGVRDLLTGAPGDGMGHAYVLNSRPYLFSDSPIAPQSTGGLVTFSMDFPSDAAGMFYAVLASNAAGSTRVLGADIPLRDDFVFRSTLNGIYPAYALNFWGGFLDPNGDGAALLAPAPGQIKPSLIGRTFVYAAVALPAGGPIEYVSVTRDLLIVP